ncbi:MAG: CRTAC1 family protein [Balneolaceae bacterium]|nr:CRTAC1 family protein [Balneolaceae bacterium]
MNRKSTARIGVGILFLLLLAIPVLLSNYDRWDSTGNTVQNPDEVLARYGFYLTEVSSEAGVDFRHQGPRLHEKLDHIMPQIASMGASVTVVDYNNDGWQDLYFTNSSHGSKNALYRNNGDGSFTDVADKMGVADLNREGTGVSMGSVWGDYNNDGYEDLFVYQWGRQELYRNERGEAFTRVTERAGLPEWMNSNTAVWFDYDRDGLLDLFIGGYYQEDIDLWNLESTKIMPESFEYANNGGRNYLYRNRGDGRFEEVSEELGLTSRRWALSAAATDLNGSGYPDLVIANDYGIDELFINEEGKRFRNETEASGIGFAPKSGMNVSFGDIMNQGNLAIYITNISEPGILIQGNNLWVPELVSEKMEEGVRYQNLAGNMDVELGGWSYGGAFGDLNNDGFIDLYVTNGYVSAKPGTDYWYDFSKVAGGHKNIIEDARNWPDMQGRSLSGYQENKLWINDGAGKFREVAAAVGGSLNLDSRAVAFADLWNRGVLDIIVATQNGPVKLFRNRVSDDHHWIGFKLQGTQSNRSAIGAQVELHWSDRRQLQVVTGGSSYCAQSQRPVYFGLGKSREIDKAVIRWPSGIRQTLEHPGVDSLYTITEPSGDNPS